MPKRSQNNLAVKETVKLYWSHAWRHPILLAGTLLTIPLTTLVNQFLPPLVLANILDRLANNDYIEKQVWESFGMSLLLYICLLMGGVLAWRLVDAFVWRLEAKVTRSLAHTVFQHLITQSASFHANSFSGSLVSQTNKLIHAYVRVADTTIYEVGTLVWGLIFTAVILVGRAPLFVAALIPLTILYVVVATYVTRPARRQAAVHADAEHRQTGNLADSITNVMAIKSFSGSDYEYERFQKSTKHTQNALLKLMHIMQWQLFSFSSLTRLFQLVALVTAVVSIVVYEANIATVFLILTYTSYVAEKLFVFGNNALRNYNRSFGDASDMTKKLLIQSEIADPKKPQKSDIHNGSLEFKNVTFTHDGNKDSIFKNLDLRIKPGEKIGLVGHSGSGKTTLTRLIMRFSDIDDGSITIDGQDIRNITQDDLRSSISFVPQEPIMFHRTLQENIQYGNFDAPKQAVEAVAKMAHAHEFIKDLPDGYDTLVGERGVKLSGGQRQRVAIARAMLKNAPILVLDEATSALDSESEVLIQDALWKLMEGRTAIVIAHRLSTIQKMDRIIVLDNGKIIEEGTHKELIRNNGKYAELWAHQSGGFLEE